MPVPSSTYYPRSMQERKAWCINFNTIFQAEATGLGFSAAEKAEMDDDIGDFIHLAETQMALDNFATAFRQFRISFTEDPVGTPQPDFPLENFTAPPNGQPAGFYQRLIQTVERIRAHPSYTDELGANLGIRPSAPEPEGLEDQSPSFKAKAAPGNVVIVEFTRGKSNGLLIERQIDAETDWVFVDKFNRSPGQFQVPPNGALPRAVRLRARFLEGNSPVGNWSNTVNLVTVP